MSKIKVKNIPVQVVDKICGFYSFSYHVSCKDCPLHNDKNECCIKSETDPNYVVELSEKEFPTNREWMESLSDYDLSAFLTSGLWVESYMPYLINLHQVIGNFTASQQGIEDWLSQPCIYLMEDK